VHQVGNYYIDI